jgi:hypothetical protein
MTGKPILRRRLGFKSGEEPPSSMRIPLILISHSSRS